MIIGIFPDALTVETVLNNLAEAEYDLSSVSVFMADLEVRARLAPTAGPLAGATVPTLVQRLTELGVSPAQARHAHTAVVEGKVLVVMVSPAAGTAAAQEIVSGLALESL